MSHQYNAHQHKLDKISAFEFGLTQTNMKGMREGRCITTYLMSAPECGAPQCGKVEWAKTTSPARSFTCSHGPKSGSLCCFGSFAFNCCCISCCCCCCCCCSAAAPAASRWPSAVLALAPLVAVSAAPALAPAAALAAAPAHAVVSTLPSGHRIRRWACK